MGLFNGIEMGAGYIAHTVFRFIQMVLAWAVVGLYGTDINKANREHKYSDGKWVYGVVTGCLSAITCILYMIPFMSRIPFAFLWDTILFILWIALFGLFGSMYIKENAEGDSGVKRMKNAVWVDLVNALLWLISAVGMAMYWIKHRNNRTRFTGRATV